MQLNDLPIACLPLELSDESPAKLIEFLYELADALEPHHAGQLMRYTRDRSLASPAAPAPSGPTDPPF